MREWRHRWLPPTGRPVPVDANRGGVVAELPSFRPQDIVGELADDLVRMTVERRSQDPFDVDPSGATAVAARKQHEPAVALMNDFDALGGQDGSVDRLTSTAASGLRRSTQ